MLLIPAKECYLNYCLQHTPSDTTLTNLIAGQITKTFFLCYVKRKPFSCSENHIHAPVFIHSNPVTIIRIFIRFISNYASIHAQVSFQISRLLIFLQFSSYICQLHARFLRCFLVCSPHSCLLQTTGYKVSHNAIFFAFLLQSHSWKEGRIKRREECWLPACRTPKIEINKNMLLQRIMPKVLRDLPCSRNRLTKSTYFTILKNKINNLRRLT